ncbi:hypothetical protein ACS5PU_07800 [Pedobacter sp. GSP4]|uniref:hypothetical protein n=1 Tax=Pedobacter sp. GSP4 TaxID=3453716 RepID=UPI003EE8D9B6
MKKLFWLVLLATQITFSFAQNVTVGPGAKPLLKSVEKNATLGTVYFNKAYAGSKVKTVSAKEFEVSALRYNLETQQLEYLDNGNVYAIQDSVQSFTLPDSLGYVHHFDKAKLNNSAGFYEVVVEGNVSLLKQYLVKKDVAEDWYTKKKIVKMVPDQAYFTSKSGVVQKLTPSAKNIAAVLPDKKDQVLTFIKTEQLDPKLDEDLYKVFSFYNKLK